MCLDPAGDCSTLWPENQIFSPPPFLFPSFIPDGMGSYYPSWNDFNRDTAIPRELSLPAATQSIANWSSLWFIEKLLLWRNSRSTHTNTHWEFSLGSSWCVGSQVRAVQSDTLQWGKAARSKNAMLQITESSVLFCSNQQDYFLASSLGKCHFKSIF